MRPGFVDDTARADLLAGATAFAYPSVYEGFGLPAVEAMAAGIPVVATAAGALPEVLGDAAAIVPVGNLDALAAALARVTTDEHDRAELIARGHTRAASFSWQAAADGVAEALEAAIAASTIRHR